MRLLKGFPELRFPNYALARIFKNSILTLQFYLKSLTKKQKEVERKYHRSGSVTEQDASGGGGDNATEDDSDLASLAREFAKEEIQAGYIHPIHFTFFIRDCRYLCT